MRTKNWVPGEWEPPGRFKVVVNGTTLDTVFGTIAGWTWQAGGTVNISSKETSIELKDLTGFEGRCDALFFSKNAKPDLPNLPGFIAAVSGVAASPFFATVYNWAWFVGFVVAAGVYLVGMRFVHSLRRGDVGSGT